jgi:hypothetical protein
MATAKKPRKRKTTNNHDNMRSVWLLDTLLDMVASRARVSSRTTRGQVEYMLACYLFVEEPASDEAKALLESIYHRKEVTSDSNGEAQSI